MKTFIISIFVLVFMVTGFVLYTGFLIRFTDELNLKIDTISNFAEQEEWQECNSSAEEFIALWNKKKKMLSIFSNNDDIAEIEYSLCELRENIRHNDRAETAITSSVLRAKIESLRTYETLSVENILRHTPDSTRMHTML